MSKRLYIWVMNVPEIRIKRGAELKSYRLEVGLTQKTLSILSKLTRSTIINIEQGRIGWNIDSEILYFETLKLYHENQTKQTAPTT